MPTIVAPTDEAPTKVEYVDIAVPEGHVLLFHPEFRGLSYGADADEAIQFGARGGMLDFYAIVPEDHPLLPGLLAAHPEIKQIRETVGPAEVFPCFIHPNSVFKTKQSLLAHMRKGEGHDATAILEALGKASDATTADASGVATDDGSGLHTSPTSNVVSQDPSPVPSRPVFGTSGS